MNKRQTKIRVSGIVLKFLRESSGFTIEEIAEKLNVTPQKIKHIEEEKDLFTLSQIKKLAEIYHRPLAAFFSEKPPTPPKALPDFRINREKRLSPQVLLAQRRAYYLLDKIAELANKKSQIPFFPINITPEQLAKKLKKYLNIKQTKSLKSRKILTYYKECIEEKLKIIIIEYPLKAADVRAFSISRDLSIIVLNEEDIAQIKLFSLFHELCHLLKKQSGICSIEIDQSSQPHIESYCNRFAAEFLVPANDFLEEIRRRKITSFDWEAVSELADIYGVSKQVIMLRALRLDIINLKQYEEYKRSIEGKEIRKKKPLRRNWDRLFFNRAGNLVIKEISKAYKNGDISFFEAIEVLNMKSKYVEKFIS